MDEREVRKKKYSNDFISKNLLDNRDNFSDGYLITISFLVEFLTSRSFISLQGRGTKAFYTDYKIVAWNETKIITTKNTALLRNRQPNISKCATTAIFFFFLLFYYNYNFLFDVPQLPLLLTDVRHFRHLYCFPKTTITFNRSTTAAGNCNWSATTTIIFIWSTTTAIISIDIPQLSLLLTQLPLPLIDQPYLPLFLLFLL